MSAISKNVVPLSTPQFETCKTCSARKFGICGALKTSQLVRLGQHTSQRTIKRGETIQFDAEVTQTYANIVSGVVKLTKLMADGRQQIVGLQFPPEFVGRPFAANASVNAEAASDLEICIFPKAAIESMLLEAPAFERRMHEQALRQLDEARDWMLALGRKTAGEKVASLLASLARTLGEDVDDEPGMIAMELVLTRAEMADFLGLTIETVSRELTKLRSSGLIRIGASRQGIIADLAALVDASELDR